MTSDMLNKYVAHLQGLKAAQSAARGRMRRLQEHWFEFGFEYSGTMPVNDPIYQPITQRSEVRPDTPISDEDDDLIAEQPTDEPWFLLSDDDAEPETNADGRYTTKAKGKGRA
ncbi:hypothetical protein FRC06_009245 [Ceratobasidium sp. 370]|nr:hypothetical protein FRC06_009245 [Ceratobasidium sp. 370]